METLSCSLHYHLFGVFETYSRMGSGRDVRVCREGLSQVLMAAYELRNVVEAWHLQGRAFKQRRHERAPGARMLRGYDPSEADFKVRVFPAELVTVTTAPGTTAALQRRVG